jgi:hypothetical protein
MGHLINFTRAIIINNQIITTEMDGNRSIALWEPITASGQSIFQDSWNPRRVTLWRLHVICLKTMIDGLGP